jgi:2-dehydropantoate 2-reductase
MAQERDSFQSDGEVKRSGRATLAVVGLGSIGGIIAGLLRAANRHEVLACARTSVDRLAVEQSDGVLQVSIRTLTDPADAPMVDWVLMCTKAHQTPSGAPWLARLCGPRTRVAVLQNGIRHADRVAPYVGGAAVVPVLVYYNGERLAAGRIRCRRTGEFDLAVPDDADGRAFAGVLEGTSLRVLPSEDFNTLAWRKLLINAVANPITALTLQRQAVLRRDDVKALCLAILDEAVTVARADGARLDTDEPARSLATLMTYPAEAGTSMYFDRLAGRPFEVEAVTGAIVAAGERHQTATPLNRMLLTLLRAVNDAAGAPGTAKPA